MYVYLILFVGAFVHYWLNIYIKLSKNSPKQLKVVNKWFLLILIFPTDEYKNDAVQLFLPAKLSNNSFNLCGK